MSIYCRGVRGATTAEANTSAQILAATTELLICLVDANQIVPQDVASVIFSTTPDLDAQFPALAARQLGWQDVALLCGHEIQPPHALSRCIRVLLHWNTPRQQHEIIHVYLNAARALRPDRSLTIPQSRVALPIASLVPRKKDNV